VADYIAPTKEMNFVLAYIANLGQVCAQSRFEESTPELVASVLEEAAKFAGGVLAPLNTVGDLIGSKIVNNQVRETSGFSEAYQQFSEAGWTAISCDPQYGGMGLPECVGIAAMEMWSAANISFGLCPLLGQGAIEALQSHASDELRMRYLEKMISGQWTGTMNLTESQAGSDLAAIKTRARRDGDHYLIEGTKIFITWGDHQMTENIIHLVLARTEDAPEGVRGISLFIVPKYLLASDGTPAQHNDVYALSVEHKIGIHGSPTCIMSFGGNDGAIGYLVGEENMGLSYMFTMMNHARLNVGVQGVALSDRAYQQAVSYARERVQGNPVGTISGNISSSTPRATIIAHADVKRMLMLMRSLTEGSRALCYLTAANFDLGHHADDEDLSNAGSMRGELLTPIAKAWSTEVSQEVTSLGVQIHGGMGYIEETGAAQFMRDARITTIYEGTTGIQANDFIGRKVLRDGGTELMRLIAEMRVTSEALNVSDNLRNLEPALRSAIDLLESTTRWLIEDHRDNQSLMAIVAVNFLMGAGTCIAGWLLAKSALIAQEKLAEDTEFYGAKITTCQFFSAHVMPRTQSYLDAVRSGEQSGLLLEGDQY
jgi:acyl-CoA dehydrogenase